MTATIEGKTDDVLELERLRRIQEILKRAAYDTWAVYAGVTEILGVEAGAHAKECARGIASLAANVYDRYVELAPLVKYVADDDDEKSK